MRSKAHLPGNLFERVTRWRSRWPIALSQVLGVLIVVSFPLIHGQRVTALTLAGLANGLALHSIATSAQGDTDKPAPPVGQQQQDDPEQMRKTIKQLTSEVQKLRGKLAESARCRQYTSVQDRLTKEEQRGEDLQGQLFMVAEKEAGLQGRMAEVNEQLRPENIDRLQVLGSLRPEQVRDATRRQLTGEKQRLQSQLDLLQQNRNRLQASLTTNEQVIQRLRAHLQSLLQS